MLVIIELNCSNVPKNLQLYPYFITPCATALISLNSTDNKLNFLMNYGADKEKEILKQHLVPRSSSILSIHHNERSKKVLNEQGSVFDAVSH